MVGRKAMRVAAAKLGCDGLVYGLVTVANDVGPKPGNEVHVALVGMVEEKAAVAVTHVRRVDALDVALGTLGVRQVALGYALLSAPV